MNEDLKGFWKFLRGDSWASFFVTLFLALIFIKLILFPFLGFVTGTEMPIFIVESCSMHHSDGWEEIFGEVQICEDAEIKIQADSSGFEVLENTKEIDIQNAVFAREAVPRYLQISPENAEVGDSVFYISSSGIQLRHEILSIRGEIFETSGERICEEGGIYGSRGLTVEDAEDWPFQKGLEKGDIVFILGEDNPEVGEVLVFDSGGETAHPIIHRVIEVDSLGRVTTKGDNNEGLLPIEQRITPDRFKGRAVFRIPYLGWVKLIFFDWRNPPSARGLC